MSGLDKILEHISEDARQEAEQALGTANAEAERILAVGREEADRMAAAIDRQSVLDVAAAAKRVQSTAELKEKRMILQAKQKMIEEVFAAAGEKLNGLADADYFDVIRKMLGRYASKTEKGTISFSEKDLKRLPADLTGELSGYGLTLDSKSVDIDGGFILSYGDIEENCSFDALISASREELQDRIGQLLFS